MPAPTDQEDSVIFLPIKVVPNASRDQIAGMLGDRLKVRVTAPPESGKANAAICRFIAKALNIKPGSVKIHSGHSSPEKVLAITQSTYPDTKSMMNHIRS